MTVCVCGSENGNFKLLAMVNDEEEEASLYPGPFRRWPPSHPPLSLLHNETSFTQTLNFTMRLISLTACREWGPAAELGRKYVSYPPTSPLPDTPILSPAFWAFGHLPPLLRSENSFCQLDFLPPKGNVSIGSSVTFSHPGRPDGVPRDDELPGRRPPDGNVATPTQLHPQPKADAEGGRT